MRPKAIMSPSEVHEACQAHEDFLNHNAGCSIMWSDRIMSTGIVSRNLRYARFSRCDFREAQFIDCDLRDAEFIDCDLRKASFNGSILDGASFYGSNLTDAHLESARFDPLTIDASATTAGYWPICPQEGEFIAWKKGRDNALIKLLIPADAKRSSATTRKCRCSKAHVLEIWRNGEKIQCASSLYHVGFMYEVGKTVYAHVFDDNRWYECSGGIHFFITRMEAELWN